MGSEFKILECCRDVIFPLNRKKKLIIVIGILTSIISLSAILFNEIRHGDQNVLFIIRVSISYVSTSFVTIMLILICYRIYVMLKATNDGTLRRASSGFGIILIATMINAFLFSPLINLLYSYYYHYSYTRHDLLFGPYGYSINSFISTLMALIWLCLMLIGLVKIYTPLKRYFQFGNGTDVTEDISRPADRPKYPNLIVAVILISIPFLVFSQYHSYENLRENLPFKYPFMELLTYIVNPILDAAYIVLQIVLVSVGLWIWHGLSGYRGRLERGMSTGFKLFAFSWWIRFVLIYCIQSIFSHQITTYMFRNSDASFHSILTYIEIIYLVFTILQVIVSFLILYAFFMILNFFHHVPRIDSFDNDLG